MGRIVVGVDGSESSLEALAWAADEAKKRGSALHVVHSWTFPAVVPMREGLPHVDLEAAAQKVLEEAVGNIDASGIEVSREVANETAAQAIVRLSDEAEMVVVGSRGLGGFKGLLLGSVTQQVAHHSRCPVVIVPHGR